MFTWGNISCVGAGQFGEGVKVEINRLRQAGCTIHYLTGNMRWEFFLQRELSTSQQQLLHMRSDQVSAQSDTTMIISAPAAASAGQSAFLEFDDTNYLFLRTANDSLRCVPREHGVNTDFGLEILYEGRDKGKIFVCDIYVCSVPDMHGLGLNYLGSSKSMTAILGVSRDRNMVDPTALTPQIGSLLHFSKQQNLEGHARALKLILDVLYQKPTSALRHLVERYWSDEHHSETAQELYISCQRKLKDLFRMRISDEDVLLLRPSMVRCASLSRCSPAGKWDIGSQSFAMSKYWSSSICLSVNDDQA